MHVIGAKSHYAKQYIFLDILPKGENCPQSDTWDAILMFPENNLNFAYVTW
jgi:Zn ribbon nucleic-acid-binding protein